MSISEQHGMNRLRLALRLADVLADKRVDPDTAEQFASGGRHVVAQLASPGKPARKVDVPSEDCWTWALEILRHNLARSDASALDAIGVGR